MSNTNSNIDNSVNIVIGKITKAQTELDTYNTILRQLYRARELDQSLQNSQATAVSKPLASDPNESFETVDTFDEAYTFIPEEYQQYLDARAESQREAERKEREENATRIQYLSSRLEELQAIEDKARQEKEEEDKKPAQKAGWKRPTETAERFREARNLAQQWAEHRKPNPHVWCSPAVQKALKESQKALKDRGEKAVKQQQLAARQAQHTASKKAAATTKANARARQLTSILEEFERAQQRSAPEVTAEEAAQRDAIKLLPHQSFHSGEGDY